MMHTVFIEEPSYHAKVTVDAPMGETPYMSGVEYIFTTIEGWKIDVTEPVLRDEQAAKRLELKALEKYNQQHKE